MKINQTFFTHDLKDYLNLDDSLGNDQYISDFRKVNFFIGPNNSGKSRIMRSMFYGQTTSRFSDRITNKFEENALILVNQLKKYSFVKYGTASIKDIQGLVNGVLIESKGEDFDLDQSPASMFNKNDSKMFYTIRAERRNQVQYSIESIISKLSSYFGKIKTEIHRKKPEYLYIPIIRGTRPLVEKSQQDIYVHRTLKDYFSDLAETSKTHNVFGGDNLYAEVENLLLGNSEERNLISEYEIFLATHFFHKKITIIPQRKKDVLLIKIGDEKERLIYNLGDGVQAIILLTFPIFVRKKKNCIFFIEEPELNLHPSLQRRILNCLSIEFPDHQYFISTHSNHFLEGISEYENVSLYSFKKSFKENNFHVKKLTSVKTDILDNLGVKNSSVLMANCTIWVEGITDRLYIQKFLEVYTNYRTDTDKLDFPLFKEDQHYSFVEYAGSNIVHWDFDNSNNDDINAAYVSNNIFLIADSDFNSKGEIPQNKKDRFKRLSSSLKNHFTLIEAKEIENILSPKVIEGVVASYEKNEKIQCTKKRFVYKKKNLGVWINNSFEPLTRDYSKDNTISDKLNFCKKAIKLIKTRDDLSNEAKNLCKKIYSFIRENNSEYIEPSN